MRDNKFILISIFLIFLFLISIFLFFLNSNLFLKDNKIISKNNILSINKIVYIPNKKEEISNLKNINNKSTSQIENQENINDSGNNLKYTNYNHYYNKNEDGSDDYKSNGSLYLNNKSNLNSSIKQTKSKENISIKYKKIQNNNYDKFKILYKKGNYATSNEGTIKFASNFSIVEVGDISESIDNLSYYKKKGVKYLFGYDWMPAMYHYTDNPDSDSDFMKWLLEKPDERTLNPDGPFPHCVNSGYDWCEDYYFNFGNEDVLNKRVSTVLNQINENNYTGVFFDWSSFDLSGDDYKKIKKNWESKYGNSSYLYKIGQYYSKLRENNILVFTNQAFREPDVLLGNVNYDMTESYIIGDGRYGHKLDILNKGDKEIYETEYFTVSSDEYYGDIDDKEKLKDTFHYLNYLEKLKKKYVTDNNFKFAYMNYAGPKYIKLENGKYKAVEPRNAIFYAYSVPKLVNEYSFTEVPVNHSLEIDSIYFYDLGKILGDNYEKYDLNTYIRYYSNAIIVAGYNQGNKSIYLKSNFIRNNSNIYDIYNNKWLKTINNTLILNISPEFDNIRKAFNPFGRVLVYGN